MGRRVPIDTLKTIPPVKVEKDWSPTVPKPLKAQAAPPPDELDEEDFNDHDDPDEEGEDEEDYIEEVEEKAPPVRVPLAQPMPLPVPLPSPKLQPSTAAIDSDRARMADAVAALFPKAEPLQKDNPSEKLEEIGQALAEVLPLNPAWTYTVDRMSPETDDHGHRIRGYIGEFREVVTPDWLRRNFGGGVYMIKIKGPAKDKPGSSVYLKTIQGVEISGRPLATKFDKHYNATSEAIDALAKMEQIGAASYGPNTPLRDPKRPSLAEAGFEGAPPAASAAPIHVNTPSVGDKFGEKLLAEQLAGGRELRERFEVLQERLIDTISRGSGGLDPSMVENLIEKVTDGNQQAIASFVKAVDSSNGETSKILDQLVRLFQAKLSERPDRTEVDAMREELKENRRLLDAAHDKVAMAVAAERQNHQSELNRLFENHRAELAQVRDEKRTEIDRAAERLDRTANEAKKDVSDAELRAEQRIAMLKDSNDALIKTMTSNYETRVAMLTDELRSLRDRIEDHRTKEVDLRDARQQELLGKTKAELERDAARSDTKRAEAEAERIDLTKIAKATELGKSIAETLGYEKAESGKPSTLEVIGDKLASGFGALVSNEKFGSLLGALAGVAAQRGAMMANPAPTMPPPGGFMPPALPSMMPGGMAAAGGPPIQTYEDMVEQVRGEKDASRVQKALSIDLSKFAPPPVFIEEPEASPAPRPQPQPRPKPRLVQAPPPPPQAKDDIVRDLVASLEDLAASGGTPDQTIESLLKSLAAFNVSRADLKLVTVGSFENTLEILASFGVNVDLLSDGAKTLLKAAIERLATT